MSHDGRSFLFAMWEGGGTNPPELGLARRLIERGHRVHIIGDPTLAEAARSVGCDHTPWRTAPHRTSLDPDQDIFKDWETRNPLAMIGNALDRFMTGPADRFATDTLHAIDTTQPDAVLVDSMILGAMLAVEAARLPLGVMMPSIWMLPAPGVPPMGPGFAPARTVLGRARDALAGGVAARVFAKGLPVLNSARHANGLAPLASIWDQVLSADRVFVLSSARFDLASQHLPSNVRYLGPILDDPGWAEPWHRHDEDEVGNPLALVAFTSNYQNHVPVLARVIDALTSLPAHGVVTLGQVIDRSGLPSAPNVVVLESASHREILSDAAVAITHCGHGTTLKALAAGVPLVCMPMGRDQNDIAARVVHHGAGVRLSPSASPARIRGAVMQVLHDPTYRQRAGELSAAITEEAASIDVVAEIEALTHRETDAEGE